MKTTKHLIAELLHRAEQAGVDQAAFGRIDDIADDEATTRGIVADATSRLVARYAPDMHDAFMAADKATLLAAFRESPKDSPRRDALDAAFFALDVAAQAEGYVANPSIEGWVRCVYSATYVIPAREEKGAAYLARQDAVYGLVGYVLAQARRERQFREQQAEAGR